MKRKWSVVVLMSAFVLLLFASCASGPQVVQVSKEEKELQKKVEAVIKGGGVAVIGMGLDESGRQDLALKKATLDGRSQLAQAFEAKMQVLEKNFVEEVGGTAKAEINTMFSSTTKAISKTTLNGSQNLSLPVTFKEGTKITVKVVVGIDPKTLNSAMLSEMKNSSAAQYERFRASQSFKDLQKEMDNYDTAGN